MHVAALQHTAYRHTDVGLGSGSRICNLVRLIATTSDYVPRR